MVDDLTDSVLDALIAMPLGGWMRGRRARRMMTSYVNGQPVTVRVSRRARPQDSWQSGEFISSTGTARWCPAGDADSLPIAAVVSERLVGSARQGVVVFSLSDGVELSVAAVSADLVRAAVANQTR